MSSVEPWTEDTIRVLLVEDEESDAVLTRALVDKIERPPIELDWVRSCGEALERLDGPYDLFLVDYLLEDGTGLDLVSEVVGRGIRTPVVVLTGKGSREVDVKAMELGAADYLVKGSISPDLLERAIRYSLDRRRSADALRESEERLRTMFDRLPLGLYRITPGGEFLDANPALIRLLGYPNRETLQNVYSPKLFVGEGDQARFRERLEAEGVVLGHETSLERRDGSVVHVRNSARLQRDADGNPEYIEGALEDVGDIARARRVRESEAHYRAIAQATTNGVLVLELDGSILEANAAAGDILGCPSEDLEGRALENLFDPQDRDAVFGDLGAARERFGGRVESNRRLRRIDGALVWARVLLAPVLDAAGEPYHLLCLLEDVAETPEEDVAAAG